MRNTVRTAIIGFFVAVVMTAFGITSYAATNTTNDPAEEVTKAMNLINEYRVSHGLTFIEYSPLMADATAVRAEEISRLYDHVRPDGTMWYTANPDYFYGEIIAECYTDAESVVAAWLNSPSHYAQIVRPEMEYLNGCVYVDANGKWWWAFELG